MASATLLLVPLPASDCDAEPVSAADDPANELVVPVRDVADGCCCCCEKAVATMKRIKAGHWASDESGFFITAGAPSEKPNGMCTILSFCAKLPATLAP